MRRRYEIVECHAVSDGHRVVICVTEMPTWFDKLFGRKARTAKFETPAYPKHSFWWGYKTHELLHNLDVGWFLETVLTWKAEKEIKRITGKPLQPIEWVALETDKVELLAAKLPKAIALK